MLPFRTILVAADFSDRSREAFRFACALAEETKTRMFVLHAVELPRAAVGVEMPIPPPLNDPASRRALEDRRRDVYVPHRPIDVEYRVRDGFAVEEVLRVNLRGLGFTPN